MKYHFILPLIILWHSLTFAQPGLMVKGKVIDAVTHAPVAYPAVYNPTLAIYSLGDSTGKFELLINQTSPACYVVISSMGYITDSIFVEKTKDNQVQLIALKPHPKMLSIAPVNALTAKTIVSHVIQKLGINYSDSNCVYDATYLQYHFEKNYLQDQYAAVRLIFADINILHMLSGINHPVKPKEKVKINKVLRSNVYEKNKDQHGDHLFDLLEENPVYYPRGTVLNIKSLNYYRFGFDRTSEDSVAYKINYELLSVDQPQFQKGYLIINKSNLAITTFYKEEFNNSNLSNRSSYSSSTPYQWQFKNSTLLIEYQQQDSIYYISRCLRKYIHRLTDNKTHSPAYEVTECFELNTSSVKSNKDGFNNAGVFSSFSNLYSVKTTYDENFCSQLMNTQFHFLDESDKLNLIHDLEKEQLLCNQFQKNSK